MVRPVIYQILALASFFLGGPWLILRATNYVAVHFEGEQAFVLGLLAAVGALAVAVVVTVLFTGLRDASLQKHAR